MTSSVTPHHRPAAGVTRPLLAGALGAALVGALWTTPTANAAPPPKNGKVTLCHATPPANARNGWVSITVSTNAVTHAGHGDHDDDIIPAFTYFVKGTQHSYAGMNLSTRFSDVTGQQILANGCALPARPEPATASTPALTPQTTTSTTVGVVPRAVVVTSTAPAPARTVPAPEAAATTQHSAVGAVMAGPSGAEVAAARATATPQAAEENVGLAAGATGDRGSGSAAPVALYAAVGGAALAVLLGLATLTLWRRRSAGARP